MLHSTRPPVSLTTHDLREMRDAWRAIDVIGLVEEVARLRELLVEARAEADAAFDARHELLRYAFGEDYVDHWGALTPDEQRHCDNPWFRLPASERAERLAVAWRGCSEDYGWEPEPRVVAGGYQKKPIPHGLRREVFERDAYRCQKCGDWHDLACDHIIPESKGGPTTLENLRCLCRSCNSKKGARDEY